jgi:hypothetical protein
VGGLLLPHNDIIIPTQRVFMSGCVETQFH